MKTIRIVYQILRFLLGVISACAIFSQVQHWSSVFESLEMVDHWGNVAAIFLLLIVVWLCWKPTENKEDGK